MLTVGIVVVVVGCLIALTSGPRGHGETPSLGDAPSHASSPSLGRTSEYPFSLGLIGPYQASQYAAMRSAHVRQTLVELSWADAEPSPGVFDLAYLRAAARQCDALRSAGFEVALNPGTYTAPSWALAQPGARYVDQYGASYDDEPLPNLVFDTALRNPVRAYLTTMFTIMGTDFSFVRAGGGHFGELGYPFQLDPSGHIENLYWAYDRDARVSDPVPGWRPGDPSPHGEAGRFLTWYLAALTAYQNWQIAVLREAGWSGEVAMLYPSDGLQPSDITAAVADDLAGRTSAEINGAVQRGYDWSSQIGALRDRRVIVYCTWGEQPLALSQLAALARSRGLPVMAENANNDDVAVLRAALRDAVALHLAAFFLVRAGPLLDGGELPAIVAR